MLAQMSAKERAAYAALTVLVLAGLAFVGGRQLQPRAQVQILPAPATTEEPGAGVRTKPGSKVLVHVVGAVRSPGLFEFQHGARVHDAIARAGGALSGADLESLNLAAPLADGTQLRVERKGEAPPATQPAVYSGDPKRYAASGGAAPSRSSAAPLKPGSISLNTGSASDLDRLPGVGPATAQKILEYRQETGGFSSIDELLKVKGIGPKKLAAMKKYLRL